MHAYLLISSEIDDQKITKIALEHESKVIEFQIEKIEQVRELFKFTKLSLNQKIAIVIKNIDIASTEAQNALLKELEEPQEKLIYILTAKSLENVVSTVVSRSQVIEDLRSKMQDPKETEKATEFIQKSIGEKLTTISKIKTREDAKKFIDMLIFGLQPKIVETPQLANFLEVAENTKQALEANGNVTLQLTNFVVQTKK